ncbi:MAG: hypothetical protein N2645_13010 [Clostridia bacterium]|nr:hypothetical protein [Clostridia bacterium]
MRKNKIYISLFMVLFLLTANIASSFAEDPPDTFYLYSYPGDAKAYLEWTSFGTGATYEIRQYSPSGPGYQLIASELTQTFYTVTGLTNDGYPKIFVVIARNGNRSIDATTQVTPSANAPGTVQADSSNWNGSRNYSVTWNLWWGNNATSWQLFENGRSVASGNLTANTPNPQSGRVDFTNHAPGTYTYKVRLTNAFGISESNIFTVTVN